MNLLELEYQQELEHQQLAMMRRVRWSEWEKTRAQLPLEWCRIQKTRQFEWWRDQTTTGSLLGPQRDTCGCQVSKTTQQLALVVNDEWSFTLKERAHTTNHREVNGDCRTSIYHCCRGSSGSQVSLGYRSEHITKKEKENAHEKWVKHRGNNGELSADLTFHCPTSQRTVTVSQWRQTEE